MIEKYDWRLMGQENFLMSSKLIQKSYVVRNPNWEHDHCEFCMKRIDENTKDAYCTEDGKHWICSRCFEDFKAMFEWVVISDNQE